MTPAHGTRLKPRASVNQSAEIQFSSRERSIVRIVDISETGVRLEIDPTAGAPTQLELFWVPVAGLAALALPGERVWIDGNYIGVRFTRPDAKSLSVLRSFVKYHRSEKSG